MVSLACVSIAAKNLAVFVVIPGIESGGQAGASRGTEGGLAQTVDGAGTGARISPCVWEMTMTTKQESLKRFSIQELETALGRALAELSGREYSVNISEVNYSAEVGLTGPGPVAMKLSVTPAASEDPTLPF